MDYLASILIKNFREYFSHIPQKKAVIGISGGVDSALSAIIAVRAIGKENIVGFRMPHKEFSGRENLSDARKVCEILDIPSQEIEISHFCGTFFKCDFAKKVMTKGNIMARIRMVLLYAFANEKEALVLGTGNKTEIQTGFFTKYGDGAVDIEILGTLWKTEVFQLAEYFGFPENIYKKPPSAELFPGQTDEKELGISYAKLDTILQRIEQKKDFIPRTKQEKHVWNLIQKSQHKRNTIPILPRSEL